MEDCLVVNRRLPIAPNLEHLKNQSKQLLSAYRNGDEQAASDFSQFHPHPVSPTEAQLTDAQLVLARSYGHPSWPRLATVAQVQRALRDDDLSMLQRVVAEHPEALSQYLSSTIRRRKNTGFKESTPLKQRNVDSFLTTFAPELDLDDLTLIPRPFSDSIVFFYGDEKILKVPKNGSRSALLKEVRLYEYLNHQQLPVQFPEPISVHEKGFYAVYSKIDGTSLCPETLSHFEAADLEAAVRSIARFFTILHRHPFPDSVLRHVPRATDLYEVKPARTRRKIQFIREHSADYDTRSWETQLDQLQPELKQVMAVTHCDPQLSHFMAIGGDPDCLAVFDFIDAHLHDPAVDIHDFILEAQSDLHPGLADQVIDLLLQHYRSDDPHLRGKVKFGLVDFEIQVAYQQVRASKRQSHRNTAGK